MYHGMRNEMPGMRRATRMNRASFLLREPRDGVRRGKSEEEREPTDDRADHRRVQEVLREVLFLEDLG